MKFVYFGYDHMLPCVLRLIEDGHELCGIFTFNCDNIFNFNLKTIALGQRLGIPAALCKPEKAHLDKFIEQGCAVFIAAGFPAKIPPPDENKAYAINLHPTLLPKGRGIMPTPTIIMHHPEAAGLSIHKLAEGFDTGDILVQEALPLAADETADSYGARLAAIGPDLLSKLLCDLPRYWAAAEPQDPAQASVFPTPDDEMRRLHWGDSIETIDKTARAFGKFGSLCAVQGRSLVVYRLNVAEEKHDFKPGRIIEQTEQNLTIAAKDGLVTLTAYEG